MQRHQLRHEIGGLIEQRDRLVTDRCLLAAHCRDRVAPEAADFRAESADSDGGHGDVFTAAPAPRRSATVASPTRQAIWMVKVRPGLRLRVCLN